VARKKQTTEPEKSNWWANRIMAYGERPASEFLPHEKNARRHPAKQRETLRGSLNTVGWVAPVIVSTKSGKILDGHARVEEALAKEKKQIVPYVEVDVTEKEERLILATFDPITGLATYDKELLESLLRQVTTGDVAVKQLLSDLAQANGLSLLNEKPAGAGGDDFDTSPNPSQTRVRCGDLWQLGDHRLLCGDCTNEQDVTRLMGKERAVLFATDPPYLVDYDGTNHPSKWNDAPQTKKAKNKDHSDTYHDWDSSADQSGLYEGFISLAVKYAIVENTAWYCWHASRRQAMLEAAWEKAGAFVHQQIIWVKNRPVLTYSWYMWAHEPCFFGWLRGQKPKRCAADHPSTTWQIESAVFETTDHPTSKPIEIFAIPMRQHTQEGDLCYEPFAGSGSQIIAAERLKRRCYAAEREPKYCDVILRRWEAETGGKAKLLERANGKKNDKNDTYKKGQRIKAG
jgi:DNA modification methylase